MRERIILAIDTSNKAEAEYLTHVAAGAGATHVKFGLELATATDWRYCSELAAQRNVHWVADAKLDDIPNTVAAAVHNLCRLDHPPVGITIHTTAGLEAMKWAQSETNETTRLLGITVLTSLNHVEVRRIYHATVGDCVMELAKMAVEAELRGIVASPQEVGLIKGDPATKDLFTMIPGTRSISAANQDQARSARPGQAIRNGADLLVIGRQVTKAKDPAAAFESLVAEISRAAD